MDIYREILSALQGRSALALATIISSSGSTPLPAGAKMLLRQGDAMPLGTVGGGRIEADVVKESRSFLGSPARSLMRRFTLTEDDEGMLCGGTVDVLIEKVGSDERDLYEELVAGRELGRDAALVTIIGAGGEKRGKVLVSPERAGPADADLWFPGEGAKELPASFGRTLADAVRRQAVVRVPLPQGEIIIEPVAGLQDLFVFGGGHVGRYVARAGAMAGFRVTVVDDRPEYANPERFPEAAGTLAVGFEECWGAIEVRPSASIVIVTRGHEFDERVLEGALQTPARYIGMIGSSAKVAATFENLRRRGVKAERLRQVHSPIGLDIGAVTAEEIAVSIVAELIAVRRGKTSVDAMSRRVEAFFQNRPPGAR